MTIEGLIERLEKAEGPDRAIDEAIYALVGFCLHPTSALKASGYQSDTGFDCTICGADSWGNRGKKGERLHDRPKPYTASVDAAATLIPEGCAWQAGCAIDFTPEARVWGHDVYAADCGANPAIALCIVALRARAAMTAEQTSATGSPSAEGRMCSTSPHIKPLNPRDRP